VSRVPVMFHVSSTVNRESIATHGLDWTRMHAAPGIAGSTEPEQHGVFLCRDRFDADFFVSLNNTGGPVDVWEVDDVDEDQLVPAPEGWSYLPGPIAPARLRLVQAGAPPRNRASTDANTTAYRSNLSITLDDGTVLTGEAATDVARGDGEGRS
jgi:hypothetical protein